MYMYEVLHLYMIFFLSDRQLKKKRLSVIGVNVFLKVQGGYILPLVFVFSLA